MGRISGKINLAALTHKIITSKKGAKCIVLPIIENNLFLSEKNNVFLDISCNEYLDSEKKQTHIIGQSVGKDAWEKLKEKGEYAPTLGSLCDWDKMSGDKSPQNGESFEDGIDEGGEDDLPF